jgi:hypothetical protein
MPCSKKFSVQHFYLIVLRWRFCVQEAWLTMFGNEDWWPLSHEAQFVLVWIFTKMLIKKVLVNRKGGNKIKFRVVSLNAPEPLEFVCIYGSQLHRLDVTSTVNGLWWRISSYHWKLGYRTHTTSLLPHSSLELFRSALNSLPPPHNVFFFFHHSP